MDILTLLRHGARGLRRRPGHTLLVVLTLALGIGGTTAIFSLVHGVLLEPLPYPEPDELVTVQVTSVSSGFGISLAIPHYLDWERGMGSFGEVGASAGWSYVRDAPGGAREVGGRAVLGDFFQVLGMETELGRVLTPEETRAGAAPRVVLGHAFWQQALGGDPAVVGSSVLLDGTPFEVVGVLAAGAGYPRPDVELYTPMGQMADRLPWDDRDSSFGTRAVARLAPGATLEAAESELDQLQRGINAQAGESAIRTRILPLDELLLGDVRPGLKALLAASFLLLIIAGANVANLALARSESRMGELAVRRSLGADRRQVAGLLAAESLWLGLAGGTAGVLLAVGVARRLPELLPLALPGLLADRVGVDPPVLGFALLVSLGATLLFGLAPTVGAWRELPGLRVDGRTTGGRGGRRLRDALVVGQVALSLTLLAGSGLLVRSLLELSAVDKGFDATGVLTAELQPPRDHFADAPSWQAFWDRLVEALEASPEVERASATLLLPLSGSSWEQRIRAEAGPVQPEDQPSFLFNIVGEGYFETLGIPVLRGRTFTAADGPDAPPVTVVDERMAEHFWPGEDPVGKRVSWMPVSEGGPEWRTVVGVVANTRHYELETPSRIQGYMPLSQATRFTGLGLAVAARIRGEAGPALELLRRTTGALDPAIPLSEERMLSDYVADELGPSRALGTLTGLFGTLAALLAALGLFGVLTLTLGRRRRELGVRMALGATPGRLAGLVARQAGVVLALGTVLGLAGAVVAGRVLASFLFEVEPVDPGSLALAAGVLLVAAALAVARPALQAAATPPGRVLRDG